MANHWARHSYDKGQTTEDKGQTTEDKGQTTGPWRRSEAGRELGLD